MIELVAHVLTALAAVFAHPVAVIDQSDHTITITADTTATYPVGLGAKGWETPTGVFTITGAYRTENPDGSYGPAIVTTTAVGRASGEFNGAIAIHGTNRPELVGGNPSHGCVRMLNADVVEVATTVEAGSLLYIRD